MHSVPPILKINQWDKPFHHLLNLESGKLFMGQSVENTHKDYFYDMPIDLFCVIHPDNHQILQANVSFETTLGWKSEEVLGKTLESFINSDIDKMNIDKAFSKIKLGIHSITFETEIRTKNNLLRYIDWKCYLDDEKKVFAIGRDITSHKEIEKTLALQTHIDHVTGVSDRQAFLTLLQNELSNAAQYHFATAIIVVDIDHFKNFNEKYGVQKGDDCLRQVATALKTCLRRKTDFLARYENDEFIVLLSHNNLEKAVKAAEYLRSSLEKLAVRNDGDLTHQPITISLGVTAIPETMEIEVSVNRILKTARRALNISQQRGGNQVNFFEDL
jgi:diguanylate cyclase (GGDEF)-like protein/PAS domain S-box-containing protein